MSVELKKIADVQINIVAEAILNLPFGSIGARNEENSNYSCITL